MRLTCAMADGSSRCSRRLSDITFSRTDQVRPERFYATYSMTVLRRQGVHSPSLATRHVGPSHGGVHSRASTP